MVKSHARQAFVVACKRWSLPLNVGKRVTQDVEHHIGAPHPAARVSRAQSSRRRAAQVVASQARVRGQASLGECFVVLGTFGEI